jgi:3-keto-5-aminohexanoate cleavage enzyme
MPPPALVMVAPNGARRGKGDHPAIPMTIAETARCAAACFEAGAGAIHAHLRDAEGIHILDAGLYRELIDAIRREAGPEMVVQVTSEAVGRYSPEEQRAVIEAVHPAAASVALREMMPEEGEVAEAAAFYARCRARGIAMQHILYDTTDLERLLDLRRRGVLPGGNTAILMVLGRYAAQQESDVRELLGFQQMLRDDTAEGISAMTCAFGSGETAALAASLAFGGHARVGFENSLVGPDGTLWTDNAQSTAAMVSIARALGRQQPSRAETLRILGAAG